MALNAKFIQYYFLVSILFASYSLHAMQICRPVTIANELDDSSNLLVSFRHTCSGFEGPDVFKNDQIVVSNKTNQLISVKQNKNKKIKIGVQVIKNDKIVKTIPHILIDANFIKILFVSCSTKENLLNDVHTLQVTV